jgi:hypothetical protein
VAGRAFLEPGLAARWIAVGASRCDKKQF